MRLLGVKKCGRGRVAFIAAGGVAAAVLLSLSPDERPARIMTAKSSDASPPIEMLRFSGEPAQGARAAEGTTAWEESGPESAGAMPHGKIPSGGLLRRFHVPIRDLRKNALTTSVEGEDRRATLSSHSRCCAGNHLSYCSCAPGRLEAEHRVPCPPRVDDGVCLGATIMLFVRDHGGLVWCQCLACHDERLPGVIVE